MAPAEFAAVDKNRQVLDATMLEQYLELVGPSLTTQRLEMFEKMMPGYLAILDSNMTARDRQGIAEEGHKIKGAADSVGLRHLQQLAQQIQSPELPAWWDNVQEWIDELKHEWRHDVQTLRDWVQQAEKMTPTYAGVREDCANTRETVYRREGSGGVEDEERRHPYSWINHSETTE